MSISRRKFLLLTASALVTGPSVAWGQAYPTKPISMIVPYAAGGPTDVIGRIIAEGMRATLAQPIIVENVGGAAGNLGVGRAVRLAADGYAFSIGDLATHAVNGAIYNLPYDALKDFEQIALLVSNPYVVVARKSMPASDLKGLIAWLMGNPGKALVGTAGIGSPPHLGGVLLEKLAGVRVQFVPYRGGGPQMQDLVAGQIDLAIDNPANCLPQVRAGTIKAYAATAMNRMAAAPDIPTVDEAGLPGFYLSNWKGFWVPKGTPKEVVARLNAAVMDALADPVVRKRLADLGQEIFPLSQQTPEALAAFQKAETEKWWPIIKAANIKGE